MGSKTDKIQQFLNQIDDEDFKGKESLSKWYKKLEQTFSTAKHQKFNTDLMKCVIKYIDFIFGTLLKTPSRKQITHSRNVFSKIVALINEDQKRAFMFDVTEKVFELVVDYKGDDSWGMTKELLKMYYKIIKSTKSELRNYTMVQLPGIWLYKLTDSISAFSDYDMQVLIIELIIFLYGKDYLNSKIRDLIPESQELSEQFIGIDPNHFHQDVRRFLNRLNQNSSNVFSIVCDNIKLGDYMCITPLNMEGLWVDFNVTNRVISWYCGIETFDIAEDDKGKSFELITILAEDVSLFLDSCSASGDDIILKMELRSPPINLHEKYKLIVKNTRQCIFMLKNSEYAKKLRYHVLPKIFASKKFDQASNAVGCGLQSPKKNEKLDKSIYGTDISVKSSVFWELSRTINPSSDSYEALSQSNASKRSCSSDVSSSVTQPQSKCITSKKKLVSHSTSVFRKSTQVQPLDTIVEQQIIHHQVIPDSQEADRTPSWQNGTEDFYTAKENTQATLELDSLDINICEDVILESQEDEKENRSRTRSREHHGRRVGIALQEKDYNTPITVSDTAELDETTKFSASVGFAPDKNKPSVPTLSEVFLDASPESIHKVSQATADCDTVKVSQTIEECIVEEQHNGVDSDTTSVQDLLFHESKEDNNGDILSPNNLDTVINLISSETDGSNITTYKKKNKLKKLNTTSEEPSQDDKFFTQYDNEPKRILGKVRSSNGKIEQTRRKIQKKNKNITGGNRQIAKLNSPISTEVIEQSSSITQKSFRNISAAKGQHDAMKTLSVQENAKKPDELLEDEVAKPPQQINSSSDESIFSSRSTPLEKKEAKSKTTQQTTTKNLSVVLSRMDIKTVKTHKIQENAREPGAFSEDEIANPLQRMNVSIDKSVVAANSSAILEQSAILKQQKTKKVRQSTKKAKVNNKINYSSDSSDESIICTRKKKTLRIIDSSQTTDDRKSEKTERIVRKKSPQNNVFVKPQDNNAENRDQAVKTRNYQIEDSTYTEQEQSNYAIIGTKAYVDELIEKLAAEDLEKIPSKSINKSHCEDEFDKLKNKFLEQTFVKNTLITENNDNNLESETGHPLEQESHANNKIKILSQVTIVRARSGYQLQEISIARQREVEDKIEVMPDKEAGEMENLRERNCEIKTKSLNKDFEEIRTTYRSKQTKKEDEICIMTDEQVYRTENRRERYDQKQPFSFNYDFEEEIMEASQSRFSTKERSIETIADIIVHREANESGILRTHHAEELEANETPKDDVTKNGKVADDIVIYNTEKPNEADVTKKIKQPDTMVKYINMEDDVDCKAECISRSVLSRRRKRKLFDETIPGFDVPMPQLNEKMETTRTNEKSIETNEKENDVTFGSRMQCLRDKNIKGLTLVTNLQPLETSSAFNSNAKIPPVVDLEDTKRNKNISQIRSAKKVKFDKNENRDKTLWQEVYADEEKKRCRSDTKHSQGAKSKGLRVFYDLLQEERQAFSRKHELKSKKSDNRSYAKKERSAGKTTSRRQSRKKSLDTVMRREKEARSPELKIRRKLVSDDANVTPVEFDIESSKIPPVRSMLEGESNDRKECDEYIYDNLEAPAWVANALQGRNKMELRSSDYQGKYLLMFFYPSDFGFEVAAPKELEEFSAIIETFRSLNVEVLGCCTNDINVHHELLAQKPNILIPLIADPTHAISIAFRVYVAKWGYNYRAAVFIDPKGTIVWRIILHDVSCTLSVDKLLSEIMSRNL